MKKLIASLALIAGLSGCASNQTQKNWEARKATPEFKKEKSIFKEQIGGKEICWNIGVVNFLFPDISQKPSKDCLYPNTAMFSQDGDLKQGLKTLRVVQVTPGGFLVDATSSPNVIFIYRTDEVGIVDGSYLDEVADWNMYEFSGPYSYKSAIGSKTVYSFKKVPASTIKQAQSGLKTYNLNDEISAQLGLWSRVSKPESK